MEWAVKPLSRTGDALNRKGNFYNSVVDKFSLNFLASHAKEAKNLWLHNRQSELSTFDLTTRKFNK